LEHCFGTEVVSIVKLLSKVPKENYIDRLVNCNTWKVLTIKACDRLDNLRSLMIDGVSIDFKKKQVKETKEKYFPIFNKLLHLTPPAYINNVSIIRDEIRSLISKYEMLTEIQDRKDKEFSNKACEAWQFTFKR
jgi:L-rhamnose mutarotase